MKSVKGSPKYLTQRRGKEVSTKDDLKKRRTSSRPIRRKKFDDELVESSLSKSHRNKHSSTASSSVSLQIPASSAPSTSSTRTFMEAQLEAGKRRKPRAGSKRMKASKSYVREVPKKVIVWRPSDDLALILSLLQTNDLLSVHQGVKFSCKFSLKEVEERWKALLYDAATAKSSQAAIRQLPPEEAAQIRRKVLFSKEEEQLIASISKYNGTIEEFQTLLNQNKSLFFPTRTPEGLREHWAYMKRYNLLSDQIIQPNKENLMTFSDAEEMIDDEELQKVIPKDIQEEAAVNNLARIRKIKVLENEVAKWDAMVENTTISSNPDALDISTIASLKGRCVNYLMQSQEVTFGRADTTSTVDIDLSLEGPAFRISRRQGLLRMDPSGTFFIINEGKKPVYVDGIPVITNEKYKLWNNAVIEIAGLTLTFHTNPEGIQHMRKSLNLVK